MSSRRSFIGYSFGAVAGVGALFALDIPPFEIKGTMLVLGESGETYKKLMNII